MALRQTLERRKWLIVVLVAGAVAAAGWTTWNQVGGTGNTPSVNGYFTVDDGQSYFVDSVQNLPPYDKDGKQAVRAYVFDCNGSRKVLYLERYSEGARKVLAEASAAKARDPSKPPGNIDALIMAGATGKQLKRPGENTWVAQSSSEGLEMQKPKCDDGVAAKPVYP